MSIAITISPNDIDEHIKAAVLKSALGVKIKETIDKEVEKMCEGGYYRTSPIQSVVQDELQRLVRVYLQADDVKPKLIEAIKNALAEDIIDKAVNFCVGALECKLNE